MPSPLLSPWSRWRSLWKHTSEIVNKSLVWSEGSYKADCSLTTDTNINPATKATCMLYKGTTLSLSVSLTLPDFIMKIDPISNSHCFASQLDLTYQQKHEQYTMLSPMMCLTLADLCFYATQRCVEQLQDVWCWCMLLLFRLTRQRDTSHSSAPKRWESSGLVFISIQPPVKPEFKKKKKSY